MREHNHTKWRYTNAVYDIVAAADNLRTGCKFALHRPWRTSDHPATWQIDVTPPTGVTSIINVTDILPPTWSDQQSDHVRSAAIQYLLARTIRSLA